MKRHLLLALPLALLACNGAGGSGKDPGGDGGSLCIDQKTSALKLLGGNVGTPGLRRDGEVLQLGGGILQASITAVAADHLEVRAVAGSLTFGWTGTIPPEIQQGAKAQVFQRDGWDYVASGGVTLAVFHSANAKPPPSPVDDPESNAPSWTEIAVVDGCTADVDCGELQIHQLLIDEVKAFPGYPAEVGGWTLWNRGVVTSDKTCDERAATLLTAVRKPAAP